MPDSVTAKPEVHSFYPFKLAQNDLQNKKPRKIFDDMYTSLKKVFYGSKQEVVLGSLFYSVDTHVI